MSIARLGVLANGKPLYGHLMAVRSMKEVEGTIQGKGAGRIMFVDDEEDLIVLVQEVLTRLGYEPIICLDSGEALEAFRADPQGVDLVITDQIMPTMRGNVLAQELRRIRPDIPIILCTGFGHHGDATNALDPGIDAVLTKPWAIKDFALVIRCVLEQSQNRAASDANPDLSPPAPS